MGDPVVHAYSLGRTHSHGPGCGRVEAALLPLDAEPVDAGPEVAAVPGSVHTEAVCGPET